MEEGTGKPVPEAPKVANIGGKESKRVDSLGWITESTVMPRKRRDIHGVGAGSIVDLRAELYRTQEDAKKSKEGLDPDRQRSRKKIPRPDVFSKKNSGVEGRAGLDELHFKTANDGSASYAALEKKAELYDKLVRGDSPMEDEGKYNVLFYKKGTLEDEFQEMDSEKRGELPIPIASFQESHSGSSTDEKNPPMTMSFTGLSQQQKLIIKEVNDETKQQRENLSNLKQRREEIASKKREQLRKAYLQKKLASIRQSDQLQPPPGDGIASAIASNTPETDVA